MAARALRCHASAHFSGRRTLKTQSAAESVPAHVLDLLNRIAIVLCSPQGPINVGATARALQNFAFNDLRLVSPDTEQVWCTQADVPHQPYCATSAFASQAFEHATSASWLLEKVQSSNAIFDDVTTAASDATLVIGTSARAKDPTYEFRSIRAAAPSILEHAAQGGNVSLLFGNERTGLRNEEIALAHQVVCIPAAGIGSGASGRGVYTGLLAYEMSLFLKRLMNGGTNHSFSTLNM